LIQGLRRKTNKFPVHDNDKLVNFVICGTQKGGTTALYSYLREHPEICMADRKEVHFFDNETLFVNVKPNYSQYHVSFNPRESHKLLGEATPIYMYWHDAPRRIWEYNSDMKLIVILRNPIDRAYSHWNMEKNRNTESLAFWDAIQNEGVRCREALPYQHRVYSYIDRGFYLNQLRKLWHYFSTENVLVLKNEYLKKQPDKCLKDVCVFLGVKHFENVTPKIAHSLSYTSKMSAKERKYLQSIFEYEIMNIERVLKWDCSDWLPE